MLKLAEPGRISLTDNVEMEKPRDIVQMPEAEGDLIEYVVSLHQDAPFHCCEVWKVEFPKDVLPSTWSYVENAGKRLYYQIPTKVMAKNQAEWLRERSKLYRKSVKTEDGIKKIPVEPWLIIMPVEEYKHADIPSRQQEAMEILKRAEPVPISQELIQQQIEQGMVEFEKSFAKKLEELDKTKKGK